MICKTCGATLSPDDIFCGECGLPVIVERKTLTKCPQCGALVQEGEAFCGECGAPLASSAPSAASVDTTLISCPRCGAPGTAGMAFCGECGFQLTTSADVSDFDKTVGIGTAVPSTVSLVDASPDPTLPSSPTIEADPYAPASYAPDPYAHPEYSAPPVGLKIHMPPAKPVMSATELAEKERGKSLFSRPDDDSDLL